MSDMPVDYRDRLDLREQIARIDDIHSRIERQQASESRKLDRDRSLAPGLAIIGIAGGAITVARSILRASGRLP